MSDDLDEFGIGGIRPASTTVPASVVPESLVDFIRRFSPAKFRLVKGTMLVYEVFTHINIPDTHARNFYAVALKDGGDSYRVEVVDSYMNVVATYPLPMRAEEDDFVDKRPGCWALLDFLKIHHLTAQAFRLSSLGGPMGSWGAANNPRSICKAAWQMACDEADRLRSDATFTVTAHSKYGLVDNFYFTCSPGSP